MRILITGGAGFIGSHLAERWLKEGASVEIIDDLSTGSLDNVAHLKQNLKFSCALESIFDAPLVSELVDRCDMVYHLAAAVGVRLIVDEPIRSIETNVHGTEVILRAAANKKKPVVMASTSEIYGKSVCTPFREDTDIVMGPTTKIRWSYACSKALDEFLGLAYWREKQVPVTIARLFNTVGPRQTGRYGMVIPKLVGQALRGEPITVYGSGEQTRCFAYVGEVVECLVRIGTLGTLAGEVINIGNDQEVCMNQVATLVKGITRSSSEIVHIPYDVAYSPGFEDMPRRVPCLEKADRLLGFRPRMPLDRIISIVAAGLRQQNRETQQTAAIFDTDEVEEVIPMQAFRYLSKDP
jgi:UDP-glucose 4-epimerase